MATRNQPGRQQNQPAQPTPQEEGQDSAANNDADQEQNTDLM